MRSIECVQIAFKRDGAPLFNLLCTCQVGRKTKDGEDDDPCAGFTRGAMVDAERRENENMKEATITHETRIADLSMARRRRPDPNAPILAVPILAVRVLGLPGVTQADIKATEVAWLTHLKLKMTVDAVKYIVREAQDGEKDDIPGNDVLVIMWPPVQPGATKDKC